MIDVHAREIYLQVAELSTEYLLLQSVWLTATADRDEKPSEPLSIRIAKLRADDVSFSVSEISYDAGSMGSGTLPGWTGDYNQSAPISFNLQIPVPLTVLFNSSSPHSAAAFLGEVSAATWRLMHAADDKPPATYAVYNHPLPLTADQEVQVRVILALFAGLFILIPFCYIPASIAGFIVKERTSKAKHLQLVSGTSPYM